jgi:hypothetical protein
MTRRAAAAAAGSVSKFPAKVIRAFHSAQPRPRGRVAASSESAARNASRLAPVRAALARVLTEGVPALKTSPQIRTRSWAYA